MKYYPRNNIKSQNDVVFSFDYLSLASRHWRTRALDLLLHPRGRSKEFTKIKAKLERAVQVSITTRVLMIISNRTARKSWTKWIHERFACHIGPSFLIQGWFGFHMVSFARARTRSLHLSWKIQSPIWSRRRCLQTAHCMSFWPTMLNALKHAEQRGCLQGCKTARLDGRHARQINNRKERECSESMTDCEPNLRHAVIIEDQSDCEFGHMSCIVLRKIPKTPSWTLHPARQKPLPFFSKEETTTKCLEYGTLGKLFFKNA